jgi:hypothetical protein
MITAEERQARKIMGPSNLMRGLAQNRPHTMMSAYRRVTQSSSQRKQGLNWAKYDMSNIFKEAFDRANQQREPTMEQVFSMDSEQCSATAPASAEPHLIGSPLPVESPGFETDNSPESGQGFVRSPTENMVESPPVEQTCTDDSSRSKSIEISTRAMLETKVVSPTCEAGAAGDKVIHLPSSQGGDDRVAGSYASCKVPQLIDECAARGIETKRNMRKAALVKLLQEHDRVAKK